MILNNDGMVVDQVCQEIPKIIKNVAFDIYQIMPNHLHAIIELNQRVGADLRVCPG